LSEIIFSNCKINGFLSVVIPLYQKIITEEKNSIITDNYVKNQKKAERLISALL
jgi:hypothetical protein